MAVLVEVACPLRVDHFLACLCQLLSVYLLLCLVANVQAILVPMPIAAGSMTSRSIVNCAIVSCRCVEPGCPEMKIRSPSAAPFTFHLRKLSEWIGLPFS